MLGHGMRLMVLGFGWLMVAIGAVGVFLPLLPTTPFLIVAAGCFARSSPRFEAWLLAHRTFGPILIAWRERGAIPRKSKWLSAAGMALGYALFWVGSHPGGLTAAIMAAVFLAISAYVWSRPE